MPADPFVTTLEEWLEISMRHSMRNFIRFARERGFSMSHLGALIHLHRLGSCGVTEIGDHLGVTSAAASQMLDRLVGQGLVSRSEDPEDRRVKRIVLTDKGRRILEESLRARQSWLEDLAHILSESEKAEATAALSLLIAKLDQLAQPAVHVG
jgi:DNA-binding MarR family transcriptional regulator